MPTGLGKHQKLWRQCTAQGHAEARYHLGSGYDSGYYGLDVPEDDAEAVKYRVIGFL